MHTRTLATLIAAFFAGLAGGWVSRFVAPRGADIRLTTVKAERFELVDSNGKVVAFLGSGEHQDTGLIFLDEKMRQRAKFGVWADSGTPQMIMSGDDGKERFSIQMSRLDDRPMIMLRDHERTRIRLGFEQNDVPGPKDENWALRFYRPDGSEEDLAGIGMYRDLDDKMQGFTYARAKDGHKWSEPK
jgi:hypothetical protein